MNQSKSEQESIELMGVEVSGRTRKAVDENNVRRDYPIGISEAYSEDADSEQSFELMGVDLSGGARKDSPGSEYADTDELYGDDSTEDTRMLFEVNQAAIEAMESSDTAVSDEEYISEVYGEEQESV